MKLRCDEAIDIHGRKKRVKYQGYFNERNHLIGGYYLQYDQDAVYHAESSKTKKVVETKQFSSWDEARDYFLYMFGAPIFE
jgi:hypothetical protein